MLYYASSVDVLDGKDSLISCVCFLALVACLSYIAQVCGLADWQDISCTCMA